MAALDTREIHGYRSDTGYRVFTEEALRRAATVPQESGVADPG